LTSTGCPICGLPKDDDRPHPPCGICSSSNQITRICARCRRYNREHHIDWNERDMITGDQEDVAGDDRRAPRAVRDQAKPTRRRGRPRDPELDELILALLLEREVPVRVHRVDARGRSRGYYWRTEYLSRRQIARSVAAMTRRGTCDPHSVARRLRDYFRHTAGSSCTISAPRKNF
jgi:hypothetical protein